MGQVKVITRLPHPRASLCGTYHGKTYRKPGMSISLNDTPFKGDAEAKEIRESELRVLGKVPEADAKAYLTYQDFAPHWMTLDTTAEKVAENAVEDIDPAPASDAAPKKRGRRSAED